MELKIIGYITCVFCNRELTQKTTGKRSSLILLIKIEIVYEGFFPENGSPSLLFLTFIRRLVETSDSKNFSITVEVKYRKSRKKSCIG